MKLSIHIVNIYFSVRSDFHVMLTLLPISLLAAVIVNIVKVTQQLGQQISWQRFRPNFAPKIIKLPVQTNLCAEFIISDN